MAHPGHQFASGRLEGVLADGSLSIKRLGALLPGGSDIAVSGRLDTVGALPRFDGSLLASADNFRDLLRWTGAAVDGVPAVLVCMEFGFLGGSLGSVAGELFARATMIH